MTNRIFLVCVAGMGYGTVVAEDDKLFHVALDTRATATPPVVTLNKADIDTVYHSVSKGQPLDEVYMRAETEGR